MAALASYAKQADDRSLEQACTRIRSRAIKRVAEIIESLPKEKPGPEKGSGDKGRRRPLSPRQKAAEDAGLSKRQVKQAIERRRGAGRGVRSPRRERRSADAEHPRWALRHRARIGRRRVFALGTSLGPSEEIDAS